jgi:hypothetical protein
LKILQRKNRGVLRNLIVVFGWATSLTPRGSAVINSGDFVRQNPAGGGAKAVTFRETLAPILREKCTPCHFGGGKVFDRLLFDRYETVRKLGKKLNTRLKGGDADLVTRWINNGSPEQEDVEGKKRQTPNIF